MYMIMNNLFAKITESLNDSEEISREISTHMYAYGSLSKGDAYEDLRSTTPKGVTVVCLHTCEHVYLGNSKNKMLSFLFLESDFSNRRLLLHYTKSQFNSSIFDEMNINMTNSISTDEIQSGLAFLLLGNHDGFRTFGCFVDELKSVNLDISLICESLLGGPSPTKQE